MVIDLTIFLSRESSPIKPPTHRSTPVSTMEQQQPIIGDEKMTSHSPSIHKAVSLSSRHTQTIPQNSNYHTATSPPEGQGGSTGLNESEEVGSYDTSQATIQDPVPGQRRGRRSGRTRRKLSRRITAPLKPFPLMPIDLQSFDLGESQQGHTHAQVRQNDLRASRMLFILIPAYPCLTQSVAPFSM